MKRSSFIRLSLLAISLFTLPFTLTAKRRKGKGFLVGSGKDRTGKSISLFEGDTFFTKVTTEDTDGSIYVFESTRIKKGGPSLHYHYEQDFSPPYFYKDGRRRSKAPHVLSAGRKNGSLF